MSYICFVSYGIYDEELAKNVEEELKTYEAYPKSILGKTMLGGINVNNNVVSVTRDLMDIDGYGYKVFEKLMDDNDGRTEKQKETDDKQALTANNVIKALGGFFDETFLSEEIKNLLTNAVIEGGVKCSVYVDDPSCYNTYDFGSYANELKVKRGEYATKVASKVSKTTEASKKAASKTTSKGVTATYDAKIYEITKQGVLKKYKGSKKADIEIPNVVKKISDSVFEHYGLVKNISISNSVVEIGNKAFRFCKSIENIVIGESVTSIGDDAFSSCESLTNVVISASVSNISASAFCNCVKLVNFDVEDGNKNYKSIDGNLYSANGKVLIKYAEGKTADSFVIPNHVEIIGDYAFNGCKKLKNITFPSSIVEIGKESFARCKSIKSIELPSGIVTINDSAFAHCDSITNIKLPETLTNIGNYAFDGCSILTDIVIPNSVISIGYGAFQDCTQIAKIVIPESVENMGHNVFYFCPKINVCCEASSQPVGWNKEWCRIHPKISSCSVTWGYKD